MPCGSIPVTNKSGPAPGFKRSTFRSDQGLACDVVPIEISARAQTEDFVNNPITIFMRHRCRNRVLKELLYCSGTQGLLVRGSTVEVLMQNLGLG